MNSIFNQMGFQSPLTISQKIVLRDGSTPGGTDLNYFFITKVFKRNRMNGQFRSAVCISYVSEKAAVASAYLRTIDKFRNSSTGFIMGN